MRRALDLIFRLSSVLAAVFIVCVFGAVLTSIISRILGFYVPGSTEYAGYFMAASSSLALGPTLRVGGHIRVTVLLERLPSRLLQKWELVCSLAGFGIAAFLVYFAFKLVWESYLFKDVSQSAAATLLWIPQIGLAVGCLVFALALLELAVDPKGALEAEKIAQTNKDNLT